MWPHTRDGASHTKVTRAQPMRSRGKQHLGSESRSGSRGGAEGEGGWARLSWPLIFFFCKQGRPGRGLHRGAARGGLCFYKIAAGCRWGAGVQGGGWAIGRLSRASGLAGREAAGPGWGRAVDMGRHIWARFWRESRGPADESDIEVQERGGS